MAIEIILFTCDINFCEKSGVISMPSSVKYGAFKTFIKISNFQINF